MAMGTAQRVNEILSEKGIRLDKQSLRTESGLNEHMRRNKNGTVPILRAMDDEDFG